MAQAPSTVAKIISRAYREANVSTIGVDPTTAQLAEGLDNLNSFSTMVLGQDLGEPLTDWLAPAPQRTAPVAANFPQGPRSQGWGGGGSLAVSSLAISPYPPINKRITFGGQTQTVYFPERATNGSRLSVVQGSGKGASGANGDVLTLDGNGRYIGAPGDVPVSSVTLTFNDQAPVSADYMFVAAYGLWVPIGALTAGGNMVFPPDYDDYWIIGLAGRLAPKQKMALSVESQAAFLMA